MYWPAGVTAKMGVIITGRHAGRVESHRSQHNKGKWHCPATPPTGRYGHRPRWGWPTSRILFFLSKYLKSKQVKGWWWPGITSGSSHEPSSINWLFFLLLLPPALLLLLLPLLLLPPHLILLLVQAEVEQVAVITTCRGDMRKFLLPEWQERMTMHLPRPWPAEPSRELEVPEK